MCIWITNLSDVGGKKVYAFTIKRCEFKKIHNAI